MGEAAREHTPELPLDDPRWLLFRAAHQRLAERTHDDELAVIDLMELLAQGRLPCMARSTVTGERKRVAATAWVDEIELLFWKNRPRVFSRHPSMCMVARRPTQVREQVHGWFYVWQPDLDRIWSTATATVDHDGNAPPRVKPGPKPRGDWPTQVARWLIAVAVENPKRLGNVDALVIDAQHQIKGTPSDPKVLRARMVELLRGVRP